MKKKLNINKTVITVISLNILQISVLIGIILYSTLGDVNTKLSLRLGNINVLLAVIILFVLFNSFIAIRDAYTFKNSDDRYHMLTSTLSQVEDLNKTLRAQRHDFLNHLQVVYSLMEIEEYKEARDYIDKVYYDIQKVTRVLKTSVPAINALLQAKVLFCEKRGIPIQLDITSQLKDLPVPSWEMCRVLGNLIDNSIDALKETNGSKHLSIDIYEDLKYFVFRVKNNGPMIPAGIRDRIFEAGFTTKGTAGEGMGLAISRDIITKYAGSIELISNDQETVFIVQVPK